MKYIKIVTLTLGLVILSGLVFVGVANAQSFKSGDTISVPASETINGMLFATGSNIDIAGTVNGDVYCAGQTINISGTVNGDVICAGQTVNVSGKIDGSLRLAGQTVTLSGTIGNSATIATQDLTIDKNAVITRDLLGGSQNVTVNGSIGRDFVSGTRSLTVYGTVGRDVRGGLDTLTVGSTGVIGGNVDYYGTKDPVVTTGGKITGTITRTTPKKQQFTDYSPVAFAIGWFIYSFIAMLALALVMVGLFPRVLEKSAAETMKKPGKAALVGALAIILTPVFIVMLFMTVIGAPLAILTILTWIVIMILSTPFAAFLLGRALLRDAKQKPIVVMLLGASILIVSYFIPIIGFITLIAAYLFGVGMILVQSKQLLLRAAVKK